jgi:WD40 repeat protein
LEEWSQFSASPNNCTAWYVSSCAFPFYSLSLWGVEVTINIMGLALITVLYLLSGSLDSEAGIYALSYDLTGSRLISCEADKTIKMWKEDENATPETHPLNFKPPKDIRRF